MAIKDFMILFLVSVFCALGIGFIAIPWLRKIKMGQFVREDGPQSHLQKAGTPTMGGIIFLFPFVVFSAFLWKFIGPVFWATLACALIGFADDYIKVVLRRSLGLKAYQKLILQMAVIVGYLVYLKLFFGEINSIILIPFLGEKVWDLGALWYVLLVFVILGTTNGANLTDGLDGLSASVTSVMVVFIGIVALMHGNMEIFLLSIILLGGLLGFLFYNSYPAKVFMGDTGSLALGGFVAFASVQLKIPLFILLFGIIYLAESVSVILQVAYFKKTGKRIFKMTPIHHHFELCGWKESKIVYAFTLVTVLGSVVAFLGILL